MNPSHWGIQGKGANAQPVHTEWNVSARPARPAGERGERPGFPDLSSVPGEVGGLKVVYGKGDASTNPNYHNYITPESIKHYDEFVREVGNVRLKYEAAMREMEVRFTIIDRELELKGHRNPIHHVETRVKEPRSMFEKLLRYGKQPTIENLEKYLMDVAGVRVICSYVFDVYNMLDLLKRQDDLEVIKVKDYIKHPKPNGYRSLHVIARIPVYFMDSKQMIPVEVQLRTIAMDFWASLEHELKYKGNIDAATDVDAYEELKDCSRIIEGVEKRMQVLARSLDVSELEQERDAAEGAKGAQADGASED